MHCSSCGHLNPDRAKFCAECGQPLAAVAQGQAGQARQPEGAARAGPAAPFGERKQVTVLFVDVRDSMQLAEQVGAEEWHRVLDRFFQILNEGVYRFEGSVNQYTGDGIMALFGVPLAHEDHAERACQSALHLRERMRVFGEEIGRTRGLAFAVRMGLNSGEVVVGTIGDAQRADYTAQGHTVGLAQRVEQLAAPHTIYLAEATAALVADYFALREVGLVPVKGASEPVRVFELTGSRPERSRIDVVRTRSTSRFVGRRAELARLRQAFEDAQAGHGQVVGIIGEPGIGKTRLCLELIRHARARRAAVAAAHCPPYAAPAAPAPLVDLVRSILGVRADAAPEASRRAVRRALGHGFNDALPLVYDLLGVPDPERPLLLLEEQQRVQRAAFLHRLVQTRSASRPLVLFVDDAHCLAAEGDALLAEAVDALGWTRTLLLVTVRPGYRPAWMTASYYCELCLGPLPAADIDELMRRLLGSDASTADLRQLIIERTGGNPFFAEEVVRSLVAHGVLTSAPEDPRVRWRLARPVTEFAIPPTIQASLAARLDRLAPREKLVLQTAAVIGITFSSAVLREIILHDPEATAANGGGVESIDAALSALQHGDFVHRDGADYAFTHPLTQAVAYGSQLLERRQRLHVAVARALQSMHPDRLGQHAGLLAHHYAAANWVFEARRWQRRAALRVTSIEVPKPRRR